MQRVVSAQEMRWCDETTINRHRTPGLVLMENAGRGVAEYLQATYGPLVDKHIVVVCGKGNNGGDGFVIARHCSQMHAIVTILLVADPSDLKGDARTNYRVVERWSKDPENRLGIRRFSKAALKSVSKPQLIVDAIFGTGFSGRPTGAFSQALQWINGRTCPVVAVDIPSGVNGTSGVVEGKAVSATATVTFGLIKSGLLCNQGRALSGSIEVVDIGIPGAVANSKSLKTFLVRKDDLKLPQRSLQAHKYSTGKVFVLAGSRGYVGAAAMTSQAALRTGAGAVVLGTPEAVYPILARKLTEVIVTPLPSTADGTLSLQAYDSIRERLAWADIVVVGPGLSQQVETRQLVVRLLSEYRGDMLLDADGLNAVAREGSGILKRTKATLIITPHVGELSRLMKKTSREIEDQRIDVAREFAVSNKLTVVLKGAPTATATEKGSVFLNSTGNPGMATVGTGDILAGMIAALKAQGMGMEEAAWSGVFLHGLAGDLARDRFGERSLVATDLLEFLPQAFRDVETAGAH
ncbi:MAG: NAD(P)H-hydrate dehydratase [Bacteroidota bacterium]